MDSQFVDIFVKMLGTAAVILVVAGFIAVSPLLKQSGGHNKWKYILQAGLVGGLFGIYGNLSGTAFNGALISVRDIGPMLAGFVGGPVSGLIGGFIAGAHRLALGGITAPPCIVATCIIGILCGFISLKQKDRLVRPHIAFITGILMELMHLGIMLAMVRPFSAGISIVKGIAVPFVFSNAVGFTLMIAIMTFIENQTELTAEKNRLESELAVAEKIQRSMLPVLNNSFPGRKELTLAALMEPAKVVGGDFYDVFFVDKDRIAFLIADVAGKGVPAALFMMNAKQILTEKIMRSTDLGEAISAANDELCQRNEAGMFVTAWIGILDLTCGKVEYVNAGHNPPLMCTGAHAEYMITRSGLVLAGMEGIRYRQNSFELKPGDMLFLYTDGVTEAENKTHEQLGEDALKELLDSVSGSDTEQVVVQIRDKISEHVAGFEQSDDITMLCIRLESRSGDQGSGE